MRVFSQVVRLLKLHQDLGLQVGGSDTIISISSVLLIMVMNLVDNFDVLICDIDVFVRVVIRIKA